MKHNNPNIDIWSIEKVEHDQHLFWFLTRVEEAELKHQHGPFRSLQALLQFARAKNIVPRTNYVETMVGGGPARRPKAMAIAPSRLST